MSELNMLKNSTLELEEMAKSGLYLGYPKSRSNPKMKPFIWSTKNGFQIIDLETSLELLKKAANFLVEVKRKNGVILFVGSSVASQDIVREAALALDTPHATERWLGGTLTNFATISRRITYLKDLESEKAAGGFEKYTKYEAMKLEEKMRKLEIALGGLKKLARLPDAVFVASAAADNLAVREARRKNIPVIGLVNTNSDPTELNFPIPANDNAKNAVKYIVGKITDILMSVKPEVAEGENKTK